MQAEARTVACHAECDWCGWSESAEVSSADHGPELMALGTTWMLGEHLRTCAGLAECGLWPSLAELLGVV